MLSKETQFYITTEILYLETINFYARGFPQLEESIL